MKFKLILKNEDNTEYSLFFKCYETNIAIRWFDALEEQCSKDNQIKEKDRLYNFPNIDWSEEKLVNELNKCINIINFPSKVIFHNAFINMPQAQLNHLHHYFEKLRGGVLSPAHYWENANEKQRHALEYYNVLIHRAENFYHTSKNTYSPRLICTFKHRKRYNLHDEDYPYFTLVRKFGEVYINYCEVGKTLFDVFKDNDDIVGDDNIRPLRYYSADFMVTFYNRFRQNNNNYNIFLEGMNKWWDKNEKYLNDLGFVKNDPKNAIGNIPIAIIDTKLSNEEIIESISNHPILDRVEIL